MTLKEIEYFNNGKVINQAYRPPNSRSVYKIVVLGDNAVGKTKFIKNCSNEILPNHNKFPIGLDFHTKTLFINDHPYTLQIWEPSREKQFRFLFPLYCRGADAAILVYNVKTSNNFIHIEEFIKIVRNSAGDIPICLVGYKVDSKLNRMISMKKGKKIFKKFRLTNFIELSSETAVNANKIFQNITRNILKHEMAH